jgi:hypothetical protein
MRWMLDLRTYGMKIFSSSTADGHIDWQGDTVLYEKTQFTMADFRGMGDLISRIDFGFEAHHRRTTPEGPRDVQRPAQQHH